MRPLQLKFSGVRSWRAETTIDFGNLGLFAMVGKTGAGKSSILEALFFALYGASTWEGRGGSDLISTGAPRMTAELTFEADGERYCVTRGISPSNYPRALHRLECLSKPELHWDGDVQVRNKIVELVGLDANAFKRAVLLPQGKFSEMLCSAPARRGEILRKIFRLDEIDLLHARAEELRNRAREPLRQAERLRARYPEHPSVDLALVEAGLTNAVAKHKELRSSLEAIESASQRRVDTERRRSRVLELVHQLGARLTESLQPLAKLDKALRERENSARGMLSKVETRITRIQKQLDELKARRHDVSSLHEFMRLLDSARANLLEGESAEKELQNKKTALEQEKSSRAPIMESLRSAESSIKGVDSQIDALVARIGLLGESTRNCDNMQERLNISTSRVNEARDAGSAARREIKKLKPTLDRAHQHLQEVEIERDSAVRQDLARTLALELNPGDDCPVCARELPRTFKTPSKTNVKALTERCEEAQEEIVALRERVAAQQQSIKDAQGRLEIEERAHAALASEFEENVRLLRVQLRSKVVSLATLTDTARRATAEAENMKVGLLDRKSALQKEGEAHGARLSAIDERIRSLLENINDLYNRARERRASYERNVDGLPSDIVPASAKVSEIVAAQAKIASLERAAQELGDDFTAGQNARSENLKAVAALEAERNQTIGEPLNEVRLGFELLRRAVASVRAELGDPASTGVEWDGSSVARATECSSALEVISRELAISSKATIAQWTAEIGKLEILVATELRQRGTTLEQLRVDLDDARAQQLDYERQCRRLQDIIPIVTQLDTLIGPVAELERAADEVARHLRPAAFLAHILSRKQEALLAVGSEILLRMTNDRFAFGKEFAIVDNDFGAERTPDTLSGGESFLASLALALSLVEIAARSGGRLEGFFLDEGFGNLDQECLEAAMVELEGHAGLGRIVGVISHIREIAERVPTIIHVNETPRGSAYRIVSDAERDNFLEDALATETV